MVFLYIRTLSVLTLTLSGTLLVYAKPFPGLVANDLNANNQNTTRGLYSFPKGLSKGLWPNGKVYYRFEKENKHQILNQSSQNYVQIAMDAIRTATDHCIQFMEDKDAKRKSGVIIFKSKRYNKTSRKYEKDCDSKCIGYCNTIAQQIIASPGYCEIEKGNFAGSVAHEIMHALGFDHEFQRHDRDKYIKFKEGSLGSKLPVLPDNTFNMTFNYKSIMQINITNSIIPQPNPPMKPLGKPKNMGQECLITAEDRNLIERAYAGECRADKRPRKYTTDTRIPGTICKIKLGNGDIPEDDDGVEVDSSLSIALS